MTIGNKRENAIDFFTVCAKNIYCNNQSLTSCTFSPYLNHVVKLFHDMICISSEKVSRYNMISVNRYTSN